MKAFISNIVLVLVLSCALLTNMPLSANSAPPGEKVGMYTFGVVPQFEQHKLYAIWNPIITELSRRTGLSFKLVTTLAIEDFDKEFFNDGFDFVYNNSYHILKSHRYLPLVADSSQLRGILVVRRDTLTQSLKELEGKVVAFPAPNSLAASLLLRADLERVHHVKVTPLYVKTHSSVYLHVAKGLTAAGGGSEKSLGEQPPAIRNALRVIYTTRGLTSHPIAAHERVRSIDREKVRKALLAMDATPEGRTLLAKIPTKQLAPVSMSDYDKMRGWNLDAFWVDFWKEEQSR